MDLEGKGPQWMVLIGKDPKMLVYCRRRVHLLFFYNGAINLNPIKL